MTILSAQMVRQFEIDKISWLHRKPNAILLTFNILGLARTCKLTIGIFRSDPNLT
jgi:hypothetical protein